MGPGIYRLKNRLAIRAVGILAGSRLFAQGEKHQRCFELTLDENERTTGEQLNSSPFLFIALGSPTFLITP